MGIVSGRQRALRAALVGTLVPVAMAVFAQASPGAVSEFPLSAGSAPAGVAAGPDGNVWVAEAAADRLARVTPAGSVTEFTLPAGSYATVLLREFVKSEMLLEDGE